VLSQRRNDVTFGDDTDNLVISKHHEGGYAAITHYSRSRFEVGIRAYGNHLAALAV
jgi:hypothetical protein